MTIQLKDRIRQLREEKKLTQADIAQHLNISRLTYISIESGEKKPTIDQIEAIARLLGISSEDLLFPNSNPSEAKINLNKYRQMCLACIKFGGSITDHKITKTKLAKLLYLVDFSWFVQTGDSMSGLSYRALPRGPVADQFFQMTDEMFESGQVIIESSGNAFMFSIVESPSFEGLTDSELAHIQKVATKWQSADTQTIVEFTHSQSPWTNTDPGMKIPYQQARHIPKDKLY